MSRSRLAIIPVALLLASCSGSDSPASPSESEGPCLVSLLCEARLEIAPDRYLRHYRTHDLDTGAEGITRGVVIVHGAGRNATYNFDTGVQGTVDPALRASVAIVAPLFITTEEDPQPDEPFWSSGGWKRGHLSVSGGPTPRVSSFTALDTIVARFSNPALFPDMQEIVVAGHSAGGQVAHRYAAGGMNPVGVPVRYVVANPSTYLFLRAERPDGSGGFSIPELVACPDYQEWHYGLQDLNSYMSQWPDGQIEQNLVSRDVTIMVGDADTGSSQLDVTCGANLQGEHRYARGLNLMAYMDAFYPGHDHQGFVIAGVAHSSRGMFLSDEGRSVLFP